MAKKKKKKEKITYIDDGRTIADMSGTSKPSPILGSRSSTSEKGRRRATAREQWRTYKSAAKQMFLPMLVVMGIITIAFGIMYLLMVY